MPKPTMPVPTETTPVEDDKFDDLGYEKDPAVETPPKDKEVPAPKEDDKPVEKPATGYGAEEEEVTPPAPKEEEKTPEEMTEEEKTQKEISEVVKALDSKNYDQAKITKFALDNKMTKAQVEAYIKLIKDEDAAAIKAQEEARKAQRKAWRDELKNDADFGGENFDKNVDRVEKVLQNYMSNTKKVLTEKGGVLPPYIMRDLLSLAKALNPTTNLVHGEPPAPKEEQSNFLDDMYT